MNGMPFKLKSNNSKVIAISKNLKLFLVLLLFTFSLLHFTLVRAEPNCDSTTGLSSGELQFCIDKIGRDIAALSPAHEKNKQELSGLNKQLTDINKRISNISLQLKNLQAEILQREEDLAYAKKIFEEKAANQYKFLRLYDPILPFISSVDASKAFQEINLRQRAIDEDRKTMEKYAVDLLKLKKDKEALEKNKNNLASLQKQVGEQEKFLAGEVNKVESYLSTLSSRQNELAALKAGGFQTSIGDTPPTLEPCSGAPGSSNFCNPGFSPAFAAFSFGAPHRTGMSQYGAYGRSKSGQNAETILSAYYQGANLNKGFSTSTNICVGSSKISCTNVDLETYVKRIYEVPNSWGDNNGMEALKAQAVAARSYALYQMNGVGYICPTESCQVYKPVNKGGNWETAVNAVSGWVLERDGKPAPAYYSASTGGFTVSQWGWSGIKDTSGDWPNTAYEKVAGSPWFYKGWYKSRGGASCSRNNPWLSSEEMADILNAWRVLYDGAGGDKSRIVPVSCWGGNPYSMQELREIGGITSVSGVSVIYSNEGKTLSVSFSTNKGTVPVQGWQLSDPKEGAFNLRAPGYIGLKSSLFNIEKL